MKVHNIVIIWPLSKTASVKWPQNGLCSHNIEARVLTQLDWAYIAEQLHYWGLGMKLRGHGGCESEATASRGYS